jgi:riboflavin synthase
MFTGIIERLGSLKATQQAKQGRRLTIAAGFSLEDTCIGDSIAVNGACLTAVEIRGHQFAADLSPETLSKTTLGRAKIGDKLNLERALRLSDRLDGHLVSGHIDGIGTVNEMRSLGNAIIVRIGVSPALVKYMVPKGSVAIDGISLTINQCWNDGFEVSVIPHTAKQTTIGFRKSGDLVNIETDMIGKYVEKFVRPEWRDKSVHQSSAIDKEFLIKTGFIS